MPQREGSSSHDLTAGNERLTVVHNVEEISVEQWTEETIEELIHTHGPNVFRAHNSTGVPLLCDAIVKRHHDCAELLLKYAREYGIFVEVDTGECTTLEWAIKERSVAVAKFVLDRLVDRQFTVDESCIILTKYLLLLTGRLPNLMKDYWEKDAFFFDYGRMWVPASLFKKPTVRWR